MRSSKLGFFKYIIITLLCLFAGGVAEAAEVPALAQADSAYKKGDYPAAVKLYEEVAAREGVSPQLYYNLGNAYYKSGNNGMAVVSYLRGNRISPSNRDIRRNLSFIRSFVDDLNAADAAKSKTNVAHDLPSFWSTLYKSIAIDHRSNTWAIWAAGAFFLLLTAVGLYLYSSNVMVRKIGFFSSFFFLIACLAFVIFSYSAASFFRSTDQGVVTVAKVNLRKSPSEQADKVGSTLHSGTEMIVEGTRGSGANIWYNVRLNADVSGWIPARDFTLVNPGSAENPGVDSAEKSGEDANK